ncbi:MAG: hypothetical protein ACD_12C00117G0003 [uncultured bacterium]|nr:MAG: hypothetical protein ACD_12C00117G0003 [uncultured bacterium]
MGATMKIILIGFMGSGKTTVANILAKKLNLEVIEMDHLILKKSGRKNIQEIFVKDGEEHFRDLETRIAKEILELDDVVISTGGGIVMKQKNLKFLKKGKIIFLKTSFEVLEKRLMGDSSRPLFRYKIKAKKLFDLRQKMYEKWADLTIQTDNKTVKEIIKTVLLKTVFKKSVL